MEPTRRDILRNAAGIAAAAAIPSGAATEPYQLGCQTLPYRGQPLSRALEGIRNAGYRYVMPFQTHQEKPVFAPGLSSSERSSLRRQFKDEGLEPFMSFFGLTRGMNSPDGLKASLEELDLCAEFGIRTVIGTGPWYYTKFPTVPKRALDWEKECDVFYAALEKAVRHAENIGVTIALKPHTGITATAKTCMEVVKRVVSDRLKICWDAGNVSFYEGIYPDPDLPDLAPDVKAVCIKDHLGGRAEANFPVPGQGQIDHDLMFRILYGAGFNGPIAVERVDGTENAAKMDPEVIDQRIAAARSFLLPILEKYARRG
jgi:sugar phosphate isomerase/epimerase